jgi:protein tyrosine/serine phosphatase
MIAILDFLDLSLAQNRKVYLHCWGGVGRTGTVVGCFLRRRGLSGPEALARLGSWWSAVPKRVHHPRSPETDAQVDFIMDWHDAEA